MNSELVLNKHKILRIKEQNECQLERQRLNDIDVLCRLLNDNNNNNEIESSNDDKSSSCETLNALTIEEELLKAEIRHLTEKPQEDDDDEDLKEFQKIETEIRVSELNKSLQNIRKQISDKKQSIVAPLAEIESLNDTRDDSPIILANNRRECRPLTLYLPQTSDLDLEGHISNLGHDPHKDVSLNCDQSFGYLYKKNQKNDLWRKRFFLFDRNSKQLVYFHSKRQFLRQHQPRGGVTFDEIQDVYVDHSRIKSEDNCRQVFVVSATSRQFVLSTFKAEVMRIWVDVIVTGAQALTQFY